MRVWLASFVLVFAAIELFQWIKQLGGFHPTGVGLILCGLGLAAISNAGHMTSNTGAIEGEEALAESETLPAVEQTAPPAEPVPTDRSQDSISFKVRSPWR